MLYRLLITGLFSGAVAGVIVTVVHLVLVTPLIFEAEQFENPVAGPTHVTVAGTQESPIASNIQSGGGHTHDAWEPADGIERTSFTLLSNLLTTFALGLLMAMALTLYGRPISVIQGLAWGSFGFLAFALLPSLGLPPELPGAAVGDLEDRQIWWLATAFGSAGGFAALVIGTRWTTRIAGILVILAPHVIGAPHPIKDEVGLAPPELAAHFAVNSLFSSLVMWLVIGATIAYVGLRMDAKQHSGTRAGKTIS
ncbi:MAG: CbtA family protein [Pseudomonadota bacterium]|nr:CbtA family protein [Pseudomonadota bacterium]